MQSGLDRGLLVNGYTTGGRWMGGWAGGWMWLIVSLTRAALQILSRGGGGVEGRGGEGRGGVSKRGLCECTHVTCGSYET